MISADDPPVVSLLVRGTRMLALGAAAGAMVLTVAGFAGRWWWVFDLVANFRPQLLVATLLATLVALALRQWIICGVLAAGMVLNLLAVWPYLVGMPLSLTGPAPTLSIVSFNVGVSNPARGEVMAFLTEEDPDLVVLLESSFEWEAAASRAGLPLRLVSVVPPTYVSGITVLARPELGASLVGVPFDPDEGVAVRVGLDGGFIDVLAIHPPSPISGDRAGRRNRILADAGEWAAGRSLPVIVVGDFNATPWSYGFRLIKRTSGLADSLAGRGFQPTWPAGSGLLMIPIDHAFHSDDLAVAQRRTGPSLGSAHRPLLVEIGRSGGGD